MNLTRRALTGVLFAVSAVYGAAACREGAAAIRLELDYRALRRRDQRARLYLRPVVDREAARIERGWRQAMTRLDPAAHEFSPGGMASGGPVRVSRPPYLLDPDECLYRPRPGCGWTPCIRQGHPTPTSDCRRRNR